MYAHYLIGANEADIDVTLFDLLYYLSLIGGEYNLRRIIDVGHARFHEHPELREQTENNNVGDSKSATRVILWPNVHTHTPAPAR